MLIDEARWFAGTLGSVEKSHISPMIDVGSSTEEYRKEQQPWIDRFVFGPLRKNGVEVVHVDAREGPGVDIVGDVSDPEFIAGLHIAGVKSVFCASLLEHVKNRQELSLILTQLVPINGYLFISCPYSFPFHPDPIDTMFRPDIFELARLFPHTSIVSSDIVNCGTYLGHFLRKTRHRGLLRSATGMFARPREPGSGKRLFAAGEGSWVYRIPWLFRDLRVTCLALRKQAQ
jgi:hypothetical protein